MSFTDDLESVGFTFQSIGRGGVKHYALRGNQYLTYYCHVAEDETGAIFTWEFALGEFARSVGMAVGTNEVLNLFMYDEHDVHVPPSVASVVAQIDVVETRLNALRLADPGI
ncbi:MAG TPA: hypothetical protein VNA14_10345 [Mycobacteriales bacterium]|nr:hypothetical protein [Mycobacteriales bacterium]